MRKIKIIITLLLVGLFCTSNAQTPSQELVKLLTISLSTEQIIDQTIYYYAEKYPKVNQEQWQQIERGIDHKSYIENIQISIEGYYTEKELKVLVAKIKKEGVDSYNPKPALEEELFEIGRIFGKDMNNHILSKLREFGYIK